MGLFDDLVMETIELRPPKNENEWLAPCPFCGNKEPVYRRCITKAGDQWGVVCGRCTASIDPGYTKTTVSVRNIWNRRATTDDT